MGLDWEAAFAGGLSRVRHQLQGHNCDGLGGLLGEKFELGHIQSV